MKLRAFLLSAALLVAVPALAQDSTAVVQDSSAVDKARNVLVPIPAVFYTPETKLAVGLSATWIYRTGDARPEARASNVGGIGIYTFKNQIFLSLGAEHYWDEDRQQLNLQVNYRKFPNDFFGLGNDTDADFSQGYLDEGAGFGIDYLREVWPAIRAGGGVLVATSNIRDTLPGDLLESREIPGSDGGQVSGAGLTLSYDTRANVNYPTSATWAQVQGYLFDRVLGGDFVFRTATADLRRYFSFGGRSVLAIRGLGMFSGGEVPFQIMPALGGDSLLRGYFQGRFRERQLLAAQAEFRFGLWKRLGAAVFAGAGQVARDAAGLGADRFHGSAGFGLRYLLVRQEGVNLRADFGYGEDESGFYIAFAEAF